MKGVAVRIAIRPKEIETNVAEVARRDTKEKKSISLDDLANNIVDMLDEIQQNMFSKANTFLNNSITEVNTWKEFEDVLENKGGFISAHWDGTGETEDRIKE